MYGRHIYLVVHPTDRKWVITLVVNGISGVSPLRTRVITHLLSGMNHQVASNQLTYPGALPAWCTGKSITTVSSCMFDGWQNSSVTSLLLVGEIPQFHVNLGGS